MVTLPKTTPNISPTSASLFTNSRSSWGTSPCRLTYQLCQEVIFRALQEPPTLHPLLVAHRMPCLSLHPDLVIYIRSPPGCLTCWPSNHFVKCRWMSQGTTNNIYVWLGSWVVPTLQLLNWTIFRPELNQTLACFERKEFFHGYMIKLHKHSCALTWKINIQRISFLIFSCRRYRSASL